MTCWVSKKFSDNLCFVELIKTVAINVGRQVVAAVTGTPAVKNKES